MRRSDCYVLVWYSFTTFFTNAILVHYWFYFLLLLHAIYEQQVDIKPIFLQPTWVTSQASKELNSSTRPSWKKLKLQRKTLCQQKKVIKQICVDCWIEYHERPKCGYIDTGAISIVYHWIKNPAVNKILKIYFESSSKWKSLHCVKLWGMCSC